MTVVSAVRLLAISSRSFGKILRSGLNSLVAVRQYSLRDAIKEYKLPELKEEDLVEKFIHGSGPGGQKVNKAENCCYLRHTPTGLFVRCHFGRSLEENRKVAREWLRLKLDDRLHGEGSLRSLKQQLLAKKRRKDQRESDKLAHNRRQHAALMAAGAAALDQQNTPD